MGSMTCQGEDGVRFRNIYNQHEFLVVQLFLLYFLHVIIFTYRTNIVRRHLVHRQPAIYGFNRTHRIHSNATRPMRSTKDPADQPGDAFTDQIPLTIARGPNEISKRFIIFLYTVFIIFPPFSFFDFLIINYLTEVSFFVFSNSILLLVHIFY